MPLRDDVSREHGEKPLSGDLFFAGMTGFLHASALVGADGISAEAFLPYPQQIVAILPETLAGLAGDVDAAEHPGDEDTLGMEDAALNHIRASFRAPGPDPPRHPRYLPDDPATSTAPLTPVRWTSSSALVSST